MEKHATKQLKYNLTSSNTSSYGGSRIFWLQFIYYSTRAGNDSLRVKHLKSQVAQKVSPTWPGGLAVDDLT